MLAADVLAITELMASNDGTLLDGDGNSSDWIELRNTGSTPLSLAGYSLTDDQSELGKWPLPAVTLAADAYLVVFASAQKDATGDPVDDYVDAGGQYHTNFSLSADGEYLGLAFDDGSGVAVVQELSPEYPSQVTDVSYGSLSATAPATTTLLASGSGLRYRIPTAADAALGTSWTSLGFDDSVWTGVQGPVGFGGAGTPALGTNLETEMRGVNGSAWLRYSFDVVNPAAIDSLVLSLGYDDGFVAYLNGQVIASDHAPANLNYNSIATARHDPTPAVTIPLSAQVLAGGVLQAGENILAIHGLNRATSNGDFFIDPQLTAAGSAGPAGPVGSVSNFLFHPTPGTDNDPTGAVTGFVSDTSFSVDRGFYTQPIDVAITSLTPNATIRYTLDGTDPTETNGQTYATPIAINQTTTLRAAAFFPDFLPTDIDTQTYIFTSDVVNQPEIDNRVGSNAQIANSLLNLPTVSLVTAPDNLFGSTGIYTNWAQTGDAWERPVSIEYFSPGGGLEFQENAGIRIHGADTRSHSKKIFRLHFRSEYGAGKLNYPVLPESGLDSFNQIMLRTGGHDAWTSPHGNSPNAQADRAAYIRDDFLRQTQQDADHVAAAGDWAHLYLNGEYWGLYNLTERINDDFAADHYGGQEIDYDVIKGNNSGSVSANDGGTSEWNALINNVIRNNSLSPNQKFAEVQNHIDIEDFVDMMAIRIWDGDTDWLRSSNESQTGNRSKNWFATKNRSEPGALWQFPIWDSEFGAGHDHTSRRTDINITDVNPSNSIGEIYSQLRQSSEFQQYFGDRLQKLFFNGGPLTVSNNQARWQTLMTEIQGSILAESARWGDDKNSNDPFTTEDWLSQATWVRDVFFPQRNATVLQDFEDINLFSSVDAPSYSQFGGQVSSGYDLTLSASPGSIYYTLDGSDPRAVGGGISSTAMLYTGTIDISSAVTVHARTRHSGDWSGITEAAFTVAAPADSTNLRVTEINFNPHDANLVVGLPEIDVDNDEFEFIELQNVSGAAIELSNVQFVEAVVGSDREGIVYSFPQQTLQPGEIILLVENQVAFESRYGAGHNIAGQFSGKLSNGGEQLTLVAADGTSIQTLRYDDGISWPDRTDGDGSTLEVVDIAGDYSSPANWQRSNLLGGTPGRVGVPVLAGDYNQNGVVDQADYDLWQLNFNSTVAWNVDGNDNGIADAADFVVWRDNLGAALATSVAVQQPDPTELAQPLEVSRPAPAAAVRTPRAAPPAITVEDVDFVFSQNAAASIDVRLSGPRQLANRDRDDIQEADVDFIATPDENLLVEQLSDLEIASPYRDFDSQRGREAVVEPEHVPEDSESLEEAQQALQGLRNWILGSSQ